MKLEAWRREAQARERSAPCGLQGDDAHHYDSPTMAATILVLLGTLPPGAYDAGVQGQRKPRQWPLVPRPRHLLPGAFIPVIEDWPLLWREGVRTLSGGLSFLLS